MSRLHRGDEGFHYSDHSHRWVAPPDVNQEIWEAGLRAHLAQHLRASHVEELPRVSPRNAYRPTVRPREVPALVMPLETPGKDSRKLRPRARTGADHSSIAARQRNGSTH